MNKPLKRFMKIFGCISLVLSCAFIPVKAATHEVVEEFPTEIQKWHRLQGTGIPAFFKIDGEVGWCIEPGKQAHIGTNQEYTFQEIGYTEELGKKLSYIAYYGYRVDPTIDNYVLTQNLLWETIGTQAGNDGYFYVSPEYPTRASQKAWQDAVMEKVNRMDVRPSFDLSNLTLNIGESVTLEDTNGVLEQYKVAGTEGLNIEKNGNFLTITATEQVNENITVLLIRDLYLTGTGSSFAVKSGDSQAVSTVKISDPAFATLNIKVNKYGSLNLMKQDEDGNAISNTQFKVSYNADMSDPIGTYTTGANGSVLVNDLMPQTVYVQEVSVPNHLVLDTTIHSVTITPNQVATFTATNDWKEGKIQFVKKDADTNKVIQLANTQFDLYKSDNTFVGTFTTDATGTITTDALRYGDYYAIEKQAPNGYLVDSRRYDLSIREHNVTVECVVTDKKVSGKVSITKEDFDIKEAQGDATLEGAVYGIYAREDILDPSNDGTVLYKKDNLVSQGTIQNGKVEMKLDYLGKYYVQEIKAPEGYQLSTEKINFDLTYDGQNVPVVVSSVVAKDKVIVGKVSITKYLANTDSAEILIPEEGAEFTAILKSFVDQYGSFEEALKHTSELTSKEWAVLKTDKDGKATSNELAYGQYVMKQTKTPNPDIILLPDVISFNVDSQDKELKYVIKNALTESYLKVIKYEASSGKEMVYSPMTFKIWDTKFNEYVSQKVGNKHYDTFETDETGQCTLPLPLKSGKYELHEVKAPDGTLIHEDPIEFEIKSSVFEEDGDGDPVTIVKVYDELPTAKIILNKVFEREEDSAVGGAIFELTAGSDVISPIDGSVIYKQGEQVNVGLAEEGRYMTNESGQLVIADLPLGLGKVDYILKEVSTIDGYVTHKEEIVFSFEMSDDTTKEYVAEKELLNELTTTEVRKVDVFGNRLEGATLQVLDENDKIVDEWITDGGDHTIKGLTVGKTYRLHEDKAPLGYVVAKDVYFTVEDTTDVQNVFMTDIQVLFNKLDEKNEPLKDAEFVVVNTKTKDIVDRFVSDGTPYAMNNLISGHSYEIQEVKAPEGYELAQPIQFTLEDEKSNVEFTMYNQLKTAKVLVNKVDSQTKKNIVSKDFEFTRYADAECTVEMETVSADEKTGTALFDQVHYGTTYIKETKAPIGYRLSDEVVKVTFNDDGLFINDKLVQGEEGFYSIVYSNTALPSVSETPKTGDDSNIYLYSSVFGISVIGLVALKYFSSKKKENQE